MKHAIEESFPIVEINRLAVPERNAFKPIYKMHKWFARRASSVFRAILLASIKPAGTNIMEEFYKDHTNDPDTNGIRILDPFMGGGTTVIEALRLGCHVTGIDLNPVAWFIVKTEAEPVDINELKDAFKRLEVRKTASGRPLKEELLNHYKTECPCCNTPLSPPLSRGDSGGCADIIYTFWVKSAICTSSKCGKEVPLFANYIISLKSPSTRYIADYKCAHCKKEFDIDMESASQIAENSLTVNSTKDSSGDLRSNKRWSLLNHETNKVVCPWCSKENYVSSTSTLEKKKKKVPLTVLLCPHCYAVWQYRGTLPEKVDCPACRKDYDPQKGNIPSKGDFLCPSCGNKDKIITSIRGLPKEKLLPVKPYAIEGYCKSCAGITTNNLLGEVIKKRGPASHVCNIKSNNGKFFNRISPADLKIYQDVETRWEKEKETLPYPKSTIPNGQEAHRLLEHHYIYWHQMFNPRQLLCLSTLLKAIDEEENQVLKEMLLSGFLTALESNNVFTRHRADANKTEGVFARHDFQPKATFAEGNVWGLEFGKCSFIKCMDKAIEGKYFCYKPFDRTYVDGKTINVFRTELIEKNYGTRIICGNAVNTIRDGSSFVITDPPYAGNVNYSELSDFFYVWLRLTLSKTYSHFAPEITPKVEEIIENPTRGKTAQDYKKGLTEVWKRCFNTLEDNGLMVFTFHHAEGSAWESLLESLCNAEFVIEAIYPIHGESESSLHLQDKQAISYDLIHVCKKRIGNGNGKKRSWATVRQEIRKKAREEIKLIEAGRYGSEKLSPADINIILIGKCLELYSKHYGQIVDYKDENVPLQDALTSIRMMVEQLVSSEQPLPSELEHIDPISYVYLTCFCNRMEIQSDEVHKATRGILEPADLIKAGVMRKGRAKRGRTYEVKHPIERYKDLQTLFRKKTASLIQASLFPEMDEGKFDNVTLVDILHYLMGLAQEAEDIIPWLREFEPVKPQIRVAFEYLSTKNPTFQEPINKIMSLIEV
jgi:putative DNA methylase